MRGYRIGGAPIRYPIICARRSVLQYVYSNGGFKPVVVSTIHVLCLSQKLGDTIVTSAHLITRKRPLLQFGTEIKLTAHYVHVSLVCINLFDISSFIYNLMNYFNVV